MSGRTQYASRLRPPGLAETVRLRGFCPADPYNRPAKAMVLILSVQPSRKGHDLALTCFEEHCSIKDRVLES